MEDMQKIAAPIFNYIMRTSRERGKDRRDVKRLRKEYLRTKFMPLSQQMRKLLPSMIRATTNAKQSSYNPYNKKFMAVKRWCDAQLPKIQRKMQKELRLRAKARQRTLACEQAMEDQKVVNRCRYTLDDDEVVGSLGQWMRQRRIHEHRQKKNILKKRWVHINQVYPKLCRTLKIFQPEINLREWPEPRRMRRYLLGLKYGFR